ncbi:MAG: hypothetical protein JWN33_165 [Candidatus Saccharibacteria bacterium]|nr:hypothetical protein [Candidatus Saccharibacteria bacterium]
MTNNSASSEMLRDSDEWKTTEDPITDAQRVYLQTLSDQAGEPVPDYSMTRAEATTRIEELRKRTGIVSSQDIDTEDDPDLLGDEDE